MTMYQELFFDRHCGLTAVEVLEGWSWSPTNVGSIKEEFHSEGDQELLDTPVTSDSFDSPGRLLQLQLTSQI